MPTNRGEFAQLLAPGLVEIMFQFLEEFPEEYSQFLEVSSTSNAFDEDQAIASFGLAKKKPEGEGFQYDSPIQGGSKRYIPEPYGIAWQVTKEMLDDDKYDVMREMPAELMRGCRQLWEQIGANVLNLGTTTVTTIDGATLFNTAHPLLGGGTYSNRLSPDADFSITALQDIIILYENMVNERGLKARLSPTNLWHGPELQFIVGEILQSQFKPYTGNNEVNVMQGRLTPTVLHFLTNKKAWYVSSKELNKLKFKWRVKPQVDSADDFETKGTKHSIYFRIAAGATEWRGWAASVPA